MLQTCGKAAVYRSNFFCTLVLELDTKPLTHEKEGKNLELHLARNVQQMYRYVQNLCKCLQRCFWPLMFTTCGQILHQPSAFMKLFWARQFLQTTMVHCIIKNVLTAIYPVMFSFIYQLLINYAWHSGLFYNVLKNIPFFIIGWILYSGNGTSTLFNLLKKTFIVQGECEQFCKINDVVCMLHKMWQISACQIV